MVRYGIPVAKKLRVRHTKDIQPPMTQVTSGPSFVLMVPDRIPEN